MNVLHVITGLGVGGAETHLHNLLAQHADGVGRAAVLSLRPDGALGARIRTLGVPVHSLNVAAGLPGPGAVKRLRAVVRHHRPDVIQGWMYHGNVAAALARRLGASESALVWNVRHCLYSLADEKPLTRQVIRINRRLSRGVGAIVYNSRLSRQQHEALGFPASRGQVIPNGFDLEGFRPGEKDAAMRRDLGISEDALVVGHVARFHPMKDHAGFLRAAVQVAEQLPRVRFLVVGRDADLHNTSLAGIVPSELVDRFHCLGERHDVPALMQTMDVFCLSSWSEAFPNVLGEAMACAVPCVATDVGDTRQVVGDTGIVVPPRDHEALARGLMDLLRRTAAERQTLGRRARARIESSYALPSVAQAYRRLYDALGAGAAAT